MPKQTSPAELIRAHAGRPEEETRKVQVRLPLRLLRPLWRWGQGRGCRSETQVFEALLADVFGRGGEPDLAQRAFGSHALERASEQELYEEVQRRGWVLVCRSDADVDAVLRRIRVVLATPDDEQAGRRE
jgi:hypothetical protein